MHRLPYFRIGSPTLCVYCGGPGLHKDHVIPVPKKEDRHLRSRNSLEFGPVAYSCPSCNVTLSDRYFSTFNDRCYWLSKRLDTKAMPVLWSKAQIKELDYKLKTYVQLERDKRLWMRYRADFYDSQDFYLNLESLMGEPSLDPLSPKFNESLFAFFEPTRRIMREVLYL